MSKHAGSHGRADFRHHNDYGSPQRLDVTRIEIIATVILMVIGGVILFGAVSQARASSLRSDPVQLASADLNLAAGRIQLQKFRPCTPANAEPYDFALYHHTSTATSAVLAIGTDSLPLAQAPSDGITHPYKAKLSAINGVSDFTWSVSPNLPSGLSLSSDGVISGTPRAESSGIYTFTVVSNGNSDSKDLTLSILSIEVLEKNALLNWTPCQRTSSSNQLVSANRSVGTYRSGSLPSLTKSGTVQQVKLSTRVDGQQLTRTITVSN
jgi:hypothetical protein